MKPSDRLIEYYAIVTSESYDPSRPLSPHIAKYRTKREPPDVPVMCPNIYCREWGGAGFVCERCGTMIPDGF